MPGRSLSSDRTYPCASKTTSIVPVRFSFFSSSLLRASGPWSIHLQAFSHFQKAVEYGRQRDFEIVHAHLSSPFGLYLSPLLVHLTTLHNHFPFNHASCDRVRSLCYRPGTSALCVKRNSHKYDNTLLKMMNANLQCTVL